MVVASLLPVAAKLPAHETLVVCHHGVKRVADDEDGSTIVRALSLVRERERKGGGEGRRGGEGQRRRRRGGGGRGRGETKGVGGGEEEEGRRRERGEERRGEEGKRGGGGRRREGRREEEREERHIHKEGEEGRGGRRGKDGRSREGRGRGKEGEGGRGGDGKREGGEMEEGVVLANAYRSAVEILYNAIMRTEGFDQSWFGLARAVCTYFLIHFFSGLVYLGPGNIMMLVCLDGYHSATDHSLPIKPSHPQTRITVQ